MLHCCWPISGDKLFTTLELFREVIEWVTTTKTIFISIFGTNWSTNLFRLQVVIIDFISLRNLNTFIYKNMNNLSTKKRWNAPTWKLNWKVRIKRDFSLRKKTQAHLLCRVIEENPFEKLQPSKEFFFATFLFYNELFSLQP